jgi:hypothetical protein
VSRFGKAILLSPRINFIFPGWKHEKLKRGESAQFINVTPSFIPDSRKVEYPEILRESKRLAHAADTADLRGQSRGEKITPLAGVIFCLAQGHSLQSAQGGAQV